MVKDASGQVILNFCPISGMEGVAILPDGDREKFVDALLPGSEIGKHGTSILKIVLYTISLLQPAYKRSNFFDLPSSYLVITRPEQRLGIHTNQLSVGT
jgi:hypothetical protein